MIIKSFASGTLAALIIAAGTSLAVAQSSGGGSGGGAGGGGSSGSSSGPSDSANSGASDTRDPRGQDATNSAAPGRLVPDARGRCPGGVAAVNGRC